MRYVLVCARGCSKMQRYSRVRLFLKGLHLNWGRQTVREFTSQYVKWPQSGWQGRPRGQRVMQGLLKEVLGGSSPGKSPFEQRPE